MNDQYANKEIEKAIGQLGVSYGTISSLWSRLNLRKAPDEYTVEYIMGRIKEGYMEMLEGIGTLCVLSNNLTGVKPEDGIKPEDLPATQEYIASHPNLTTDVIERLRG